MSPAISAALLLLPLALAQQCEEHALLQHKSSELQLYGDFVEGNTTRNMCRYCVCEFIADAGKCGERWITDGIKCGWDEVKCAWEFVKHAAECMWEPWDCRVKVCWKVAKRCSIAMNCFKPVDFGDCLTELSGRGPEEKVAVEALKTAGTLVPDDLKEKVLHGLDSVLQKLEKFLGKNFFPEVVNVLTNLGSYDTLKSFFSKAEEAYNEASGLVTSFVNGFESFFKKAKTGSFKLPRNKDGEFCAMNWDLTMFWFDDCGFFDAFDDLTNKVTKFSWIPVLWNTFGKDFEKMGEALVKCAMLSTKIPVTEDVTLKVSTPFMSLQKMDFCMPKDVTDAAELTTNGIIDLKKHTPEAFKDLKEAADKLADYAKELFSSKPSLLQRGNTSLFQLTEVSKKSGIEGLTESFMCSKNNLGGKNDPAFMLRIQMSWGTQLKKWTKVGLKYAQAVGIGIFFGCKEGEFQVVPFVNIRWVTLGISLPPSSSGGWSLGADISIKYYLEFPCFQSYGRFKTGASLQVQVGLTSDTKKFKGTLRTSTSWWSPDVASSNVSKWKPHNLGLPHGFGFAIAMKVGSVAELNSSSIRHSVSGVGMDTPELLERVLAQDGLYFNAQLTSGPRTRFSSGRLYNPKRKSCLVPQEHGDGQ